MYGYGAGTTGAWGGGTGAWVGVGGGGGGGAWQPPAPVKPKTWATDAFVSEFCDAIADDLAIGFETGQTYQAYQQVIHHLLACCDIHQPPKEGDAPVKHEKSTVWSDELKKKAAPALEQINKALIRCELFFKKFEGYQKWKMQFYVSKMVDDVNKAVMSMTAPGDLCIFPILVPEVHDSGIVMLVEWQEKEEVRVTIVNPTAFTEYHPQKVSEANPTKLKSMVAMTLSNIPRKKILSEAWWSMVMLGSRILPEENVFYTHFLEWLTGRNHEGQLAEYAKDATYATPAKSDQTVFWKSLIHALKYVLKRNGLTSAEVKFVRHQVKRKLLANALKDLDEVKSIKSSTKLMIASAAKNTAASIARNAKFFTDALLNDSRKMVQELDSRLEHIHCDDDGTTSAPPQLDITNGWEKVQQPDSLPLMECFRRVEGVDQFAGAIVEQARLVPANFLRIPAKVDSFAKALEALNEAVTLMIRICTSQGLVKNVPLLVTAIVSHLFLEVLPHPLGPKTRHHGKTCIWSDTPMRYGQQLHVMKRLHECVEFYINAIFSLDAVMDQDATRICVLGVAAAIADAVIRVRATDKVSLFTAHYNGYKNKDKFGFQTGKFAEQTERSEVVYPEALLARADVLDYIDEVTEDIPTNHIIWKWEKNGIDKEDKPALALFRQLAHSEAYRSGNTPMTLMGNYEEGFSSVLRRQFTETFYFRDIVFWFKHLMNNNFIHKSDWVEAAWPESLRFEHNGEGFRVYGFDGSQLRCEAKPRFKSNSVPSSYTAPHEVISENDVLHIKNLTTFDDVMGQRDAELLLSYLTVPYIRIPLVLRFFATEDRVSCLRSQSVRNLLTAVVLEPGRFLTREFSGVAPEEVPAEKAELVSTAYGHLLNELFCSPHGIVEPLVRIVHLAAELDAGTVYNESTTNVILFLVKLTAHIQSYITLGIDMQRGQKGTLRDVVVKKEILASLEDAYTTVTQLVQTKVFPMIDTWIAEAMAKATEAKETADIDKATALACRLHSHVILLLRNIREDAYDEHFVSTLLSSFTFLTTRYSWKTSVLPEIELYQVMHRHRRSVVRYLSSHSPDKLSTVMDAVVRLVTSTGGRDGATNQWGLVAGSDCVGRFARLDDELLRKAGREKGGPELLDSLRDCVGISTYPAGMMTIAEGMQDVELNVQTLSLTFKAAHLRALPSEIANDANVFAVFGASVGMKTKMLETMQCAIVEEAVNRTWVRLVGQDHDVQYWKTPDPRFAIPDDRMTRYYPEDLIESEKWIYELYEPIRKAYFERNFWDPPIFILLPDVKYTADNCVAVLNAVDSSTGRKLKEVMVYRDFRTVQVFDVLSYGRRYYRRLVYTNNNRFCQHQLNPSVDRRSKPWPKWGRHAAGDPDPDASTESAQSAVIMRHPSHPDNLSGSVETWVPLYLLYGLVPSCLLETHRFWQDADDNIRGYPVNPTNEKGEVTTKLEHLLWLHWRETHMDAINTKNTSVKVFRFPRSEYAPKSSDDAVRRSQFVKDKGDQKKAEVDEEASPSPKDADGKDAPAMVKEESYDHTDADLEAGMFKTSDVARPKGPAATIEDEDLLLVNLMFARAGTPLHSLAMVLSRIELLSHILVWTRQTDYEGGPITIDLIQLPRLKLSFAARLSPDGTSYLLYSLDHAHLFICNDRPALVTQLIQGVPHSLLLCDANKAISILVPSLNVMRPVISSVPFSTELVINRQDAGWYTKLDTRYYLYPVHVSLSFMFTPTLASALYLLLMRFYHRDYADVFRVAGTIGTDMEFTPEESQIFNKLAFISDFNPNAHACRAKISLLVSDSPVLLGWYAPLEVACMLAKYNEVSVSCRLTQTEERRLLYVCYMLEEKMRIIREFVQVEANKEGAQLVMQRLVDKTKSHESTIQQRRLVRKFYAELTTKLREELDVRVVRDDLNRLLLTYNAHATKPLKPYYACLLHNRRAIVEAECGAKEGETSGKAELKVPPLGKDLAWMFYKDFNPLSCKPPGSGGKPTNDEGRTVAMSKTWDYYYCGATIRKANSCRCRGCNDVCGPNAGCPCMSCEKFNEQEGHLIRELVPVLESGKSTKQLSFFEAFLWINDSLNRFSGAKVNEQYPYMEKNYAISLRDANNAFLRFYELCTGTTKVKISTFDSARDFAELLFHFSREARMSASALGHMMHFVVQTPQCWTKLQKFNRTSKQKMDARTLAIYNSIWTMAAQYRDRPDPLETMPKFVNPSPFTMTLQFRQSTRGPETPLNLTTILPFPHNTDANVRTLKKPDLSHLFLLGDDAKHVTVTDALLAELRSLPLGPATPPNFAKKVTRTEQKLEPISPELPFDLTQHGDAVKTVAKDMLRRLKTDMADFAQQENAAPKAKIVGLSSEAEVRSFYTGKATDAYKAVLAMLNQLSDNLAALRQTDSDFLAYAMPILTRSANHIDFKDGKLGTTLVFLRRFAGKEATLSVDYLISSLCSSTATKEWCQLNPFLTEANCDAMLNLIAVTVLRANRIGHNNRASELVKELVALLEKGSSFPDALHGEAAIKNYVDAGVAMTLQKADALASQLLTKRVYIKEDFTYEPRFLLFEFTWNLVLRGRQQELIHEMYDTITQGGKSIVKQMIMGAGKTTVVGPLLGLMLANSKNLVIQVVPPALLDFTRAVLRTSFSSVVQKQIFTFNADRSAEVDSEALSKFMHAKQSRGIVVTTPSSIKSVFLKYIEGLDRISDEAREGRGVENEKEVKDLLGVLNMWHDAVLIMDEVDMLLHPLKSELNFPIGAKHDLDFTPTRWKLPIHLIDAVFYFHSKRITTNMKESPEAGAILHKFKAVVQEGLRANALQEMPHLTLLNLDFYNERIKPVLAEWLLLFLKAQHLTGFTDADTLVYVQKRPTTEDNPELVKRALALDEDYLKMLNLSYEWLNCYMPHIMQKIDRVSFGIMNNDDMKRAKEDHPNMPRSRFVTAIPFIGKDLPSQSSEFAHPDVVIGLTILAYRYEGLRDTDFVEVMSQIHSAVEKEVGRFSQRRTNIMYSKWVQAAGGRLLQSFNYKDRRKAEADEMGMQPSESIVFGDDGDIVDPSKRIEVLPLKLMKQANEDEVAKLFKLFKRTPEVIHWYLCETIFPEYMRHQHLKLSASGQELGGDMIFKRRIGFSGTPSDLLPVELGSCEYEKGTDGNLIHTLTDPGVVTYVVQPTGWTVRSLLDFIAQDGTYHALIDTGALITGMSNLQVAQYLLKHGLKGMEGVVFLDEFDRKMILVRATGRVLKLAECGIPKVKRFAFYDQVHTTGMDIEHTPNAQAIQTLGKDMVFRDFAQGAYRMRGISQGQTVKLLIIPEVYDLINRTLASIRKEKVPDLDKRSVESVLRDVTAWLLVNSIRSEHTQHNQLQLQNCANVWRKEAFRVLCDKVDEFKVVKDAKTPLSEGTVTALDVYREPVAFAIAATVPQPCMFSETVEKYVDAHRHLVNSDVGKGVVGAIIDQTKREDEVDNPTVDMQIVQEQEEERERVEEKEEEQEIEIEKFVDLAYNRDEELSHSWKLETLADPTLAVQFYKLADFHLYKRRALEFPDNVYLSKNFFNTKWSGHRRMKNVIVTMEWIPSLGKLSQRTAPTKDYESLPPDEAGPQLKQTVGLAKAVQKEMTAEFINDLLATAMNQDKHLELGADRVAAASARVLKASDFDASFFGEVCGNGLRGEEEGRYTVAVTLEEAETLRRVVHLSMFQSSVVPGRDTAVALNVVPSANVALDRSFSFRPAPTAYQSWRNYQCLRFFDCDLHYSDPELGLLLRSIHSNPTKHRQAFFSQVIACRRRARQRWERTPIALLFVMNNAFTLLRQRVVGLCIRRELEKRDLSLNDAYIAFNNSHSGLLTPDEVWGAMKWCNLTTLTANDVLDFVDVIDTTHEGNIQFQDFISGLTGDRELADQLDMMEVDDKGAGTQKKLPTIPPHGAEELKSLKAERVAAQKAAEKEANQELEAENQKVLEEIEAEQIAEEIAQVQATGNPYLDASSLTFTFHHENVPKLVAPVGGKVRRVADEATGFPTVRMQSNSQLRGSIRLLKRLRKGDTTVKNYVMTLELRLPRCTHGDTKTTLLKLLERMSKPLTLCRWTLPMYRFAGYSNSGVPPFEVEFFGVTNVDLARDAERDERGGKRPPMTKRDAGTGKPTVELLHVFAEPRPCRAAEESLAELKVGDFVRTDGQKTNNSIGGVTYEWMRITQPVEGWVVREKNGKSMWEQISTSVQMSSDKFTIDHSAVGVVANEVTGQFEEGPAEEDVKEDKDKKKEEEADDAGGAGQIGLTNDVGDLLEMIRKLKRLKPGDKVMRNPDEWDRGNEDGGRGNIGKVLRVENERVNVQWPSGHKANYDWGAGGRFDLIKVGEAEEGEEGEERETLNDDRWIAELRRGGAKCGNCSATKLEPGNWFRCNNCENFNLCKKCFRGGNHTEHDFTDMAALNATSSGDVAPGAYVKIRLSVTNPKYGWDGAEAGDIGCVLDVDKEENVVTIELVKNEQEWRGDLTEVEVTAAPKEEGEEGVTVQTTAYAFLNGLSGAVKADDLPFVAAIVGMAKEANTSNYKVGDRVKYMSGSGYPGEIRAVLPNKEYALICECGAGHQNNVPESKIKPFPFKLGDRVRIKKTCANPQYGLAIPKEKMHRLVGKINSFSSGSGGRVILRCDYEGYGRQSLYDDEAEAVGTGKWTITRTDVEPGVEPTPVNLPTSSNVLVERAFQDGQQLLQLFIRDDNYDVDLATNDVRRNNKIVGKLTRDPPEEFVKGEEKKQIDDGFTHIISLVIKDGTVTMVVDGKTMQTQFSGVLNALKDKDRQAEALATAMHLTTTTPITFMHCEATPEMARGSIQWLGPTFPARVVNWMRLDWSDGTTVDDVVAWHQIIDAETQWVCKECKKSNTRLVDVCAECKTERVQRKERESTTQGRFRAAQLRSREAQAVRRRCQDWLKLKYQRQLDKLDEAAEEVKAKAGPNAGTGGVASGAAGPAPPPSRP